MKHVVSLSGGRTSTGVLPTEVINKFGTKNVDLIFCDTGAEDDDTYRFIRDAEKMLGMKITCLKLVMPKEKGKGCDYKVCTTDDIRKDYDSWNQLTHKYGNPYVPGGKFCTDQMKTQIFKKYCSDKYGKGGFYTWLGYRHEEGQRIWGRAASNVLGKIGMNNTEKTEFYLDCINGDVDALLDEYFPSMFPSDYDLVERNHIKKALETIKGKNFRFLSELSSLNKTGVIAWWSGNEFDLKIDEHLGNCLFCMEKPLGTVMLAIKDRPTDAKEFLKVVESEDVAEKESRKHSGDIMYRDGASFRWLYEKAITTSRDEILKMSVIGKKLAKKNTCSSGECSPFGEIHDNQIDFINNK